MNKQTVYKILLSLAVAAVIGGAGLGFAESWGEMEGIHALWLAALVAWGSTATALTYVGILQDRGKRPDYGPPALHWVLGVMIMFVVCAAIPICIAEVAPAKPFLTWLAVHTVPQIALLLFLFRKSKDSR